MKLTLIRVLTVASLLSLTAPAHASDLLRWILNF